MTSDAIRRSGEDDAHADEFRLSASPAHLLRRAQQYASGIFHQAGLSGVTLRQTVVLAAIAEAEGQSQAGLVKATGVDRSTLADMIARMEKKGLVARSQAEDDARAKSVSLTAAGRRTLDQALPAMQAVDDAIIETLPRSRRVPFKAMLGALAAAADESEFFEAGDEKPKKAKAPKSAKGKKRRKGKRKKR